MSSMLGKKVLFFLLLITTFIANTECVSSSTATPSQYQIDKYRIVFQEQLDDYDEEGKHFHGRAVNFFDIDRRITITKEAVLLNEKVVDSLKKSFGYYSMNENNYYDYRINLINLKDQYVKSCDDLLKKYNETVLFDPHLKITCVVAAIGGSFYSPDTDKIINSKFQFEAAYLSVKMLIAKEPPKLIHTMHKVHRDTNVNIYKRWFQERNYLRDFTRNRKKLKGSELSRFLRLQLY